MLPADLVAYASGDPHTHAFGIYAVLEALKHRPAAVKTVLHDGSLEAARLAALARTCEEAGVPLERDPHTLERLRRRSDVEVLAVVEKADDRVSRITNHALLVGPTHAGNLGTAIRSLLAFGIDEVALIGPKVDHWSPHVVRASVGLRFAVRCQAFPDAAAYLAACGARTLHLFDSGGASDAASADFEPAYTLGFGPEGPPGAPVLSAARATADWTEPLRSALAERAGAAESQRLQVHSIQLDPRAESLNLAAAITVAAFLARRSNAGRE